MKGRKGLGDARAQREATRNLAATTEHRMGVADAAIGSRVLVSDPHGRGTAHCAEALPAFFCPTLSA
jgi:hypothetical protein